MNSLARKFFQSGAQSFREVIIVSEEKVDSSSIPSDLPRGWLELASLSSRDRVDFTRDFWLSRLPFHPKATEHLVQFFSKLDDVAVVLRKEEEEDLFTAELVYSLADESSFFRGLVPSTEMEILELKREIGAILPPGYLSFLHLHNGFGKLSEIGCLQIDEILDARRRLIDHLLEMHEPIYSGEKALDAGALIPFFETFSSFQCFYMDWYPGTEMGNVSLSMIDNTVSDVSDPRIWVEELAFPTFLEWLVYYLQGMDFS